MSMLVADSWCEKHLDLQTTICIVRTYANIFDMKEVAIEGYPGVITTTGVK